MSKAITFVTYESPWFPAGGIAAVMGQLPAAVQSAGKRPTVVITSYHQRSPKIAALTMAPIDTIQVAHDGAPVSVEVMLHAADCPWFFLKVAGSSDLDPPLFDGKHHPYDVAKGILLRDSLFFGAATVKALPAIAGHIGADPKDVEWNLIAQDWEAATALLAFASQSESKGRLHLTLHNSYDEFATPVDFSRVGIDPDRCPGDTILHRALSIIERPAFTVSEQFALDFTQDLLQREVMAPQLQILLNLTPVMGVDNGPFKSLAFSREHLGDAATGNYGPLKDWKEGSREAALRALDAHTPTNKDPVWGDKNTFRRDDSPWFVMAGRDDPRQKGYDVAAAAIQDYLSEHHGRPGCSQFLFFPIPGDEGLSGLTFLKALAERFPEDVIVFPFIWVTGFMAALQGAAYGLMPSLYEPFGMANEFYLAGGCVGIARATGGNLEQIVPLRAASACSRAVRIRADRYHVLSAHPTGILFREKDETPTAPSDWKAINEAGYDKMGGVPSRVEARLAYDVFREMANELRIAIEDGIRVYGQEPELYYRMLAEGILHIQRTFSWRRAGQEYARKVGTLD
jgi:glycosyltransferase involved in cell wall biosynthesis